MTAATPPVANRQRWPFAISTASGCRRRRPIATIPTAGPSASNANATCQPVPSVGASAPTRRIVTPVRMNPSAVWIASAEPAVPGGRELRHGGRELRRVGDDGHAPEDAEHERQPRRGTEQEPDRQRARPAAGHRHHRDRRPAGPIGDEPGHDAAKPARGDHEERAEAGQRRRP